MKWKIFREWTGSTDEIITDHLLTTTYKRYGVFKNIVLLQMRQKIDLSKGTPINIYIISAVPHFELNQWRLVKRKYMETGTA